DETAAAEAGAAAAPEGAAPPPEPPPTSSPAPPEDANDLRGYHFKLLMGSGKTWALIVVPALIVGGVLAGAGVPALGGAAFLVAAVAAWVIAARRAADAFFTLYAAQHGLDLGGKEALAPTTPLLRKGDDRYAERTLTGLLAPDCPGVLALYTYEEESTDANGN